MPEHIGFLTIHDTSQQGLIGGFLILNAVGRPLEFHCTTPVKANRAQEILYGNTLKPYLCGEQIARTLIARAKTPLAFVVTNDVAVLPAQDYVEEQALLSLLGASNRPPRLDEERNGVCQSAKTQDWLPFFNVAQDDVVQNGEPSDISDELSASLESFGIKKTWQSKNRDANSDSEFILPKVAGFSLERWQNFQIGNRHIALPGRTDEERQRLFQTVKELSTMIDLAEPFTRIRLAIEEAQRAA